MSIVNSLRKLSLKLTGAYSTGEDIEDNIEYIAEQMDVFSPFKPTVVEALPEEGVENVLYLVPKEGDEDDTHDEYIWTNNAWEKVGSMSGGDNPLEVLPSSLYPTGPNIVLKDANNTLGSQSGASVVLGRNCSVNSFGCFAEGASNTIATNSDYAHVEGSSTKAAKYAHAEGYKSEASGQKSHAEGEETKAINQYCHSEGLKTTAGGTGNTKTAAHAEGLYTIASGTGSHAEGYATTASGTYAHTEGNNTTASGQSSHAEGGNTTAGHLYTHAEGHNTTASADSAHAEGNGTTASGSYAHAEGNGTTASGSYAHAEGWGTKASAYAQHVTGKYNEEKDHTYVEIVGNGTADNARSNARTLDWQGNGWYAGNVTVAGGSLIVGSTTITEAQLQSLLALLNS